MKKLLIAIAVALGSQFVIAEEPAKKETKQVCVPVKDKDGKPQLNKDGTAKQQCKEVRVHQKLEGHEIPGKK